MMASKEITAGSSKVDAHEWNIALTVLEKLGADVDAIVEAAKGREQAVIDVAKGLLKLRTIYPHLWGGNLE
jgi:hypothetical protein